MIKKATPSRSCTTDSVKYASNILISLTFPSHINLSLLSFFNYQYVDRLRWTGWRDEQGWGGGQAGERKQTETDENKTTEQIASLIGCFIVYNKHLHHGEKLTSHRPVLANNNELAWRTAPSQWGGGGCNEEESRCKSACISNRRKAQHRRPVSVVLRFFVLIYFCVVFQVVIRTISEMRWFIWRAYLANEKF